MSAVYGYGRRAPLRDHALQVVGQGAAATAWTVDLEVSLDGSTWSSVLAHVTATGDAVIVFGSGPAPLVRVNVSALTLGGASAILVNVLSLP